MKLSPILLLWTITIAYAAPNGTCPEVDPAQPIYLRDTIECGFFYECSNGLAYRFRCPPGLYWDQEKTVCNRGVDCDGTCPEVNPSQPIYLRDTIECGYFYECSNGLAYRFSCPAGLYWDQERTVCNRGVDCDGSCPETEEDQPLYLSDTVECAVFYECSNGNPIKLRCPSGTYWDISVNNCDTIANCGDLLTTPGLPTGPSKIHLHSSDNKD